LENRQGAQAVKVLDMAIDNRPDEPILYRLRSRAYAAAGNEGNAQLDLAEAHYLNGQLENAVQQLQTALRSEKLDFYDASRIQAKLRNIKTELVEEKKAARKG
jgi:predicted Zn-dependent protease